MVLHVELRQHPGCHASNVSDSTSVSRAFSAGRKMRCRRTNSSWSVLLKFYVKQAGRSSVYGTPPHTRRRSNFVVRDEPNALLSLHGQKPMCATPCCSVRAIKSPKSPVSSGGRSRKRLCPLARGNVGWRGRESRSPPAALSDRHSLSRSPLRCCKHCANDDAVERMQRRNHGRVDLTRGASDEDAFVCASLVWLGIARGGALGTLYRAFYADDCHARLAGSMRLCGWLVAAGSTIPPR